MPAYAPSTSILDQILLAIREGGPKKCPIKEGSAPVMRDLPPLARCLIPIWHRLDEQAGRLCASSSGNDSGVWYRHHAEAEAVKELIRNLVRAEHAIPYSVNIEFLPDWKYATSG